MTPEEFVAALHVVVVDSTASGVVSTLRQPPGRSPWPVTVDRSKWFNALDTHDQLMVADLVRATAFNAAFAFCAVLDGVAAFDADRGALRLTYIGQDGAETVLNDPSRCELHAELRGDDPPP